MHALVKYLLIPLFGCSIHIANAQIIPDSVAGRIDKIFSQWNNTHTPGVAIGVVRNDSLIYAKGYGMANLEYGIPITQETIFHMASVSKQFVAYSIVLLASRGKLKLEDDVRQYLPWFPDLKEKITIRHLLNHTSGIRDQWQLLAISGTRLDDVITQEHIVKILSKQQALNFKPGEKYFYSNSGYTMLAEVVKSVTGKTLRQFTDSAIFKPLGMRNTHFHDDYTEIEKNRAYSYYRKSLFTFGNSVLSYSVAGATSLFTNINDLAKWAANFYTPMAGTAADIQQLVQNGKLNDGTEIGYALGIANDTYKGYRQYSHSGGDAGYRTYFTVFPELKMGFMVFSNLGEVNTYEKAYQLADVFIKDTTTKAVTAPPPVDSNKAIIKDVAGVKKITGDFVSDEGALFSFVLRNNKLYWQRYGNSDLLYPITNDSFVVTGSPEVRFAFKTATDKRISVLQTWPGNKRVLEGYVSDSSLTDQQLQAYAGIYHCPELDVKYAIEVKDHALVLTHNKYSDSRLKLMGREHLFTDHWWMRHLKTITDKKKKIIGFEVNDGRVMYLRFNKL
ncbi:MAG: beta-lactamase family protein [Chitinophagaceae bacterium]|nr:beta-lactamase family protein [Chitinophagaceae bacterium]